MLSKSLQCSILHLPCQRFESLDCKGKNQSHFGDRVVCVACISSCACCLLYNDNNSACSFLDSCCFLAFFYCYSVSLPTKQERSFALDIWIARVKRERRNELVTLPRHAMPCLYSSSFSENGRTGRVVSFMSL